MFQAPSNSALKGDASSQIQGWALEFLTDPEYQHAFLMEIKMGGGNRVEVFIDSDERVDFALCRKLSRHIEEQMDTTLLLGEQYTLEVSSPGTTRPLTNPRQFPKHIGRTFTVTIDAENTVQGELTTVTEEGFTLQEEVVRKEKKKKIKEQVTHQVTFGEFEGAMVKLSFK
ncbi:MAG: ribosome maturation factor RimP [Saprospiraceae bacterium]